MLFFTEKIIPKFYEIKRNYQKQENLIYKKKIY